MPFCCKGRPTSDQHSLCKYSVMLASNCTYLHVHRTAAADNCTSYRTWSSQFHHNKRLDLYTLGSAFVTAPLNEYCMLLMWENPNMLCQCSPPAACEFHFMCASPAEMKAASHHSYNISTTKYAQHLHAVMSNYGMREPNCIHSHRKCTHKCGTATALAWCEHSR